MPIFCENTDILKYFQCEIGLIKYTDEKKYINAVDQINTGW
jgi:hypothetical protein